MPVPVSPHDQIRLLASYGWGYEDVCARLRITTGPARFRVRDIVLTMDIGYRVTGWGTPVGGNVPAQRGGT